MTVLCEYLIMFMLYSVIGWVTEVILSLKEHHEFINRGFLIGPYCPIYGYGGVFLTSLLKPISNNPYLTFFGIILICSILEYLTSYFMEKIFNARWWDYTNQFMNIKGRICLVGMLSFGIMGMFGIYALNPFFFHLLDNLPNIWLYIFAAIFTIIYVTDTVISFNVFGKIKDTIKLESKDNTKEISNKVKEMISEKSLLVKRAIEAFPKFKTQLKFKKKR